MRPLDRVLFGLLAAGALAFGGHSLTSVVATGTAPGLAAWSSPLPLACALSLPVLLALALVRGNGWSGLLGASLGWTLGARALVEIESCLINCEIIVYVFSIFYGILAGFPSRLETLYQFKIIFFMTTKC